MVPTIKQVLKCYRVIAAAERMKTGRPGENTVSNCLHGASYVCEAGGVSLKAPVTALTRKVFDAALATFMQRGLTRLTAWSYVCQLRGLFARWCRPYYQDAGWEIPPLDLPAFRAKAPRYERPSAEMLARVKSWYGHQQGACWFAATMMLEFAMRNGDVLRLREENFVTKNTPSHNALNPSDPSNPSNRFLSYTPHKTELSSGRRVYWPIHPTIWRRIEEAGGVTSFDVTDETFDLLNHDLRDLGFHGSKASYELRKICIDHVYQKFGAEMAVSLSGDDIKTISRYYADPAQPNLGSIRIIDLL